MYQKITIQETNQTYYQTHYRVDDLLTDKVGKWKPKDQNLLKKYFSGKINKNGSFTHEELLMFVRLHIPGGKKLKIIEFDDVIYELRTTNIINKDEETIDDLYQFM